RLVFSSARRSRNARLQGWLVPGALWRPRRHFLRPSPWFCAAHPRRPHRVCSRCPLADLSPLKRTAAHRSPHERALLSRQLCLSTKPPSPVDCGCRRLLSPRSCQHHIHTNTFLAPHSPPASSPHPNHGTSPSLPTPPPPPPPYPTRLVTPTPHHPPLSVRLFLQYHDQLAGVSAAHASQPQPPSSNTSKSQSAGNRASTRMSTCSAAPTLTPSVAPSHLSEASSTSADPKVQDIKSWNAGFERLEDKRLVQQRYMLTNEKTDDMSKLALGAKLDRALSRRMSGQDAVFRPKALTEKNIEA
ncbi:hypothetical protein J1614_007395, partial [Plenodomus biglobosus]